MMTHHLVILGKPVSSKNNKGVDTRTGRVFTPAPVRAWKTSAVRQLKTQWRAPPILGAVSVDFQVYQGPGQSLDLDNAFAGAMDALQGAGVIKNDYQITRLSAERHRDRDAPRIEITIQTREVLQ